MESLNKIFWDPAFLLQEEIKNSCQKKKKLKLGSKRRKRYRCDRDSIMKFLSPKRKSYEENQQDKFIKR